MVSVSFMAHRQDRHISTQDSGKWKGLAGIERPGDSQKMCSHPCRLRYLLSLIAGKTMSPAKAPPRSRRNFLELAALSIGALGMGSSAGAASGARQHFDRHRSHRSGSLLGSCPLGGRGTEPGPRPTRHPPPPLELAPASASVGPLYRSRRTYRALGVRRVAAGCSVPAGFTGKPGHRAGEI